MVDEPPGPTSASNSGHDDTLASSGHDDTLASAGHDATVAGKSAATTHRETPAALAAANDATMSGSPSELPAAASAAARSGAGAARVANLDYPAFTVVDPAHYVLGEPIAQGGMGQIRLARDRRLARPVALKTVLDPRGELAVRFEREARITARLQHPAIVQIHEAGHFPSGEPFFAMPFVEGKSLDEAIRGCRTVADRLALIPHVITVAEAIAYAHEHRIIHRDIKPKNVLVGPFGETVVIDWGLAKDLADDAAPELPAGPFRTVGSTVGSTVVGDVLGTPAYMPLEQAKGDPVDERADVYAIGALLYHVLAGMPPYQGKSGHDALEGLKAGPPRALASVQSGLPPDLLAIVDKAMARDRADRYPTAKELAGDLRKFTNGQLVGAHEYSAWQLVRRWLRRHRGVVAATVVAAIALGVFAAYSVRKIVDERDQAEAARRTTLEREERLAVEHARAIEIEDPTLAIAALEKLSASSAYWTEVRPLVVSAWSRGVAARVMRGHEHAPQRVITAPDGRILSAGAEGAIRIWDARGAAIAVLEGHRGNVNDVAVSRAGVIASVGIDGTARLWAADGKSRSLAPAGEVIMRLVGFTADGSDVVLLARTALLVCPTATAAACRRLVPKTPRPTRGIIRTVTETTGRDVTTRSTKTWADLIDDAAVSPAGRIAITCDYGRSTAWDLDAGTELWIDERRVYGCGIAPDGRVALATEETLVFVDARTGKPGHTLPIKTTNDVAIAFSGDGKRVVIGGSTIRLWNVDGKNQLASFEHAGGAERIVVSADGSRVATAGDSGITLLTLGAGRPDDVWHVAGAREAAFSPDGASLVTGYVDGTLRMWRLDERRGRQAVARAKVTNLSASEDGGTLGLHTADGHLRVIDWRAAKVVADVAIGEACIDGSVSPDGAWAKAICNGKIELVQVAGGRRQTIDLPAAVWLGRDRLLAWRWNESRLHVIELAGGARRELAIAGEVTSIVQLRTSHDGHIAAVLTGLETLVTVDTATGATLATVKAPCRVDSPVALAWDGRTFACGVDREIWVDRSGVRSELRGHYEQLGGLALLADSTLVSTARDRTLRVWQPDGSSRAHRLESDSQAVPIAGRGRTLVTISDAVRVWDLDVGRSWSFPPAVKIAVPLGDGRAFAIATDAEVLVFVDSVPTIPAELATWVQNLTEGAE